MKEQQDYTQKYSEVERGMKFLGWKNEDSLPFTPYFIYEIGIRKHPYHLVFKEIPNRELYQNTIINILSDFSSVEESIECMEYHYESYPNKEQFLRHFKFSLPYRIEMASSKDRKLSLKTCLHWIEDIYEGYKMDPLYVRPRLDIDVLITKRLFHF